MYCLEFKVLVGMIEEMLLMGVLVWIVKIIENYDIKFIIWDISKVLEERSF